MKSVLVGAVESSRVALDLFIEKNLPVTVVTLPPARAARHSDYVDLRPPAEAHGIPVLEAANINAPSVLSQLREMEPDYLFVIGWSQICRSEFLNLPRRGAIGYHPALLPQNRGRAVIPWTILQGLEETGSSLFWLDEGVDSGDLLFQERFPVDPDETAATLYEKHMTALRTAFARTLDALTNGDPPRRPQDSSQATYCARRTASDGLIDWNRPARDVWTLIRAAGDPYPGAFTFHNGEKLVVWEADYAGEGPYWGLPGQVQWIIEDGALVQCGDRRHVVLKTVQREGEPRVQAYETLKNHEKLGIDWVEFYQMMKGRTE